jgi:hypothetical protein
MSRPLVFYHKPANGNARYDYVDKRYAAIEVLSGFWERLDCRCLRQYPDYPDHPRKKCKICNGNGYYFEEKR